MLVLQNFQLILNLVFICLSTQKYISTSNGLYDNLSVEIYMLWLIIKGQ